MPTLAKKRRETKKSVLITACPVTNAGILRGVLQGGLCRNSPLEKKYKTKSCQILSKYIFYRE